MKLATKALLACTVALSSASSASAAITYGASTFWNTETDLSGSNTTITNNFDASIYKMLVVIVTGENGNPGDLNGNSINVTYDGVGLTQIIDRNPIAGTTPLGATVDQTYNSMWVLASPSTSTGSIVATVNSRGNVTVIGLNADNDILVGNTAISAQESKSVDLTTASGSLVIAALGMGGNGNSANVASVNTVAPLLEISAQEEGNTWDGHVVGYQENVSAGTNSYAFTGGNTIGTHTIAAEFYEAVPVPEPSSLALMGLGGIGMLMFRYRRTPSSVRAG